MTEASSQPRGPRHGQRSVEDIRDDGRGTGSAGVISDVRGGACLISGLECGPVGNFGGIQGPERQGLRRRRPVPRTWPGRYCGLTHDGWDEDDPGAVHKDALNTVVDIAISPGG